MEVSCDVNSQQYCGIVTCTIVLGQVSEENDDPIIFEDGGDYSVVFDPLDGSSNIDCGVSIGTIYGIYKKAKEEAPSVANVLRVRRVAAWDGLPVPGSRLCVLPSFPAWPGSWIAVLGMFPSTGSH